MNRKRYIQKILKNQTEMYKKMLKEVGTQKEEILHKISSIVEILPICECQRVLDYLSELYLS